MARYLKCDRCGRENDPTFAFCLDCGQGLRVAAAPPPPAPACAACGARLQAGFRFCGHCGAPVAAPPTPAPPARPEPAARPAPPPAAHPAPPAPAHAAPPPRPPAPPPPPPAAHPPPPQPLAPQTASVASAVMAAEPAASHAAPPAPVPLRITAPAEAPAPPPAPAASTMRIATVRTDGLAGAVFPLERAETLCGRLEGEIRLADDPTISPRHARFLLEDGALRVEDVGSVNGTFVRIRSRRTLSPGDEIRVGRQILRLEPMPRPPHEEGRARPWGAPDPGCRFRMSQLLDGGGLGEIFPLREGENTVGREAGDLTFPSDRYVSARHARLEVHGDEITVQDVGSSNGTFVKVTGPAELAAGDQLLVGGQLLRVET